jgi:hypothetical protein
MAIAQPTRRSRRREKHTFTAGDKVEVSEKIVHAFLRIDGGTWCDHHTAISIAFNTHF